MPGRPHRLGVADSHAGNFQAGADHLDQRRRHGHAAVRIGQLGGCLPAASHDECNRQDQSTLRGGGHGGQGTGSRDTNSKHAVSSWQLRAPRRRTYVSRPTVGPVPCHGGGGPIVVSRRILPERPARARPIPCGRAYRGPFTGIEARWCGGGVAAPRGFEKPTPPSNSPKSRTRQVARQTTDKRSAAGRSGRQRVRPRRGGAGAVVKCC